MVNGSRTNQVREGIGDGMGDDMVCVEVESEGEEHGKGLSEEEEEEVDDKEEGEDDNRVGHGRAFRSGGCWPWGWLCQSGRLQDRSDR